eukprot:1825489-Pleurochrysis_carterae.AAC.21
MSAPAIWPPPASALTPFNSTRSMRSTAQASRRWKCLTAQRAHPTSTAAKDRLPACHAERRPVLGTLRVYVCQCAFQVGGGLFAADSFGVMLTDCTVTNCFVNSSSRTSTATSVRAC